MFESWIKNKTVSVIAPAGRVEADLLKKSVSIWRSWGAKVKIMPHVCGFETQFFSAPCDLRAEDINSAFGDAETDFVICARGGYGCVELHDKIDWELLHRNPKVLVGYSDITALHMMMLKHGCGEPVSGAMFLKAPELFAADRENADTFVKAVSGKKNFLETDKNYDFCGFCIVANLAVLASLCGSGLLPDFHGKCLILEDLNEPPYKIHRMLVQLELAGIFDEISAIGFGEFQDCGENPAGLRQIFDNFAQKHKLKCFFDLPIGHGNHIHAVNMTRMTQIKKR